MSILFRFEILRDAVQWYRCNYRIYEDFGQRFGSVWSHRKSHEQLPYFRSSWYGGGESWRQKGPSFVAVRIKIHIIFPSLRDVLLLSIFTCLHYFEKISQNKKP